MFIKSISALHKLTLADAKAQILKLLDGSIFSLTSFGNNFMEARHLDISAVHLLAEALILSLHLCQSTLGNLTLLLGMSDLKILQPQLHAQVSSSSHMNFNFSLRALPFFLDNVQMGAQRNILALQLRTRAHRAHGLHSQSIHVPAIHNMAEIKI